MCNKFNKETINGAHRRNIEYNLRVFHYHVTRNIQGVTIESQLCLK